MYSDCGGQAPVPLGYAVIDTCIGGVLYFVGHNPGVFSPLMQMGAGARITYWDGGGNGHTYRIIATRSWRRSDGPPPPAADATVQFQTCQVADGSVDRILDATPA